MDLHTEAIVISAIKYGDNALIVKMYTDLAGIQTYMVKGALNSRRGKFRPGYFLPLTHLEIVASKRDKGGFEYLKEVKTAGQFVELHTDMSKSAIVMFLSELLHGVLKEEEADEPLFAFLVAALHWLEHHDKIANFHLIFLIHLCRYLGIYPDAAQSHLPLFDLVEGEFTQHTINPAIGDAALDNFRALLEADFDTSGELRMSKAERQELLRFLINYFKLHLQGFNEPRSLKVLNEIFN